MWIEMEDGVDSPLIQISPRLKGRFIRKWYPRAEVLAHELVHAIRLPLHSVRFEEMLAYQTSQKLFRRLLGPIIRRPFEVYVLFASLALSWVGLYWGFGLFYVGSLWPYVYLA